MRDIALEQEIALIREEIADLDRQQADGELDGATADRLRTKYEGRIAALDRATDADDGIEVAAGHGESTQTHVARERGRPMNTRTIVGTLIVVVAITGIGVLAVASLDRGGANGLEGVAGDVVQGDDVDLASITNEQMEEVVAQNPDVIGMRLALARRYFEAGEFDKALGHYFEVLDREQHPEALANIGWMTYLSGRPDIAVGYLEAALQRRSDYLPAQWFLANAYVTLGRTDEAAVLLVELASSPDVPDDVRDGSVELLEQIESER